LGYEAMLVLTRSGEEEVFRIEYLNGYLYSIELNYNMLELLTE